jgi:L-fucose isomerase-like protein
MQLYSPILPGAGITTKVLEELVGPLPTPKKSRVVVIACGVKIHFPWELACARYREVIEVVKETAGEDAFEVLHLPEPYENPDELLAALNRLASQGLAGIVFFHAAYTAGEIGSHLGRWLLDHRTPILSWSFPDEKSGGRLGANSLCCQNFLLGMWRRMGVASAWCHGEPESQDVREPLRLFLRSVRARDRFLHARVLHVGGSRVPAFYDGETDELAVMRRFGLRFDRVDLEAVYQKSRDISQSDLERLSSTLVDDPRCAGVNLPPEQILQTLRFGVAIARLGVEHGYLGCTVKSWPDLFDCYGCAIDGAVSMLNDYGFCTAEEGEMNGLLSSLALHLLSEGTAVPTMMDLSALDAGSNRIGIWHCGACPTRMLKPGENFSMTRHSILENGDPETAVGLMVEFLLATGPATVVRYGSPDAASCFGFQGELVDSTMPFRGAWCEMEPARPGSAGQIMGTILDLGLDHHWSLGYGLWMDDLRWLNHWLGIHEIPCRAADKPSGACPWGR